MNAQEILVWRLGHRRKELSLAINRNFDTRWIGELPIVFDGSPAQCVEYAESRGYQWIPEDSMLFGGRFEHPTEPNTLYPV